MDGRKPMNKNGRVHCLARERGGGVTRLGLISIQSLALSTPAAALNDGTHRPNVVTALLSRHPYQTNQAATRPDKKAVLLVHLSNIKTDGHQPVPISGNEL